MSYRRARPRNPKGLIGFAVGAAVAFAGFYGLLNSDGVSKNVVNGALVGVGRARRRARLGSMAVPADRPARARSSSTRERDHGSS